MGCMDGPFEGSSPGNASLGITKVPGKILDASYNRQNSGRFCRRTADRLERIWRQVVLLPVLIFVLGIPATVAVGSPTAFNAETTVMAGWVH